MTIKSSAQLEACIDDFIQIHCSTTEGTRIVEGIVDDLRFPWAIRMYEIFNSNKITVPFAGEISGIIEIKRPVGDGKIETIYKNDNLPIPYTPFYTITDHGLIELNLLREKCFGNGYSYNPPLIKQKHGINF